MKRVISEETVYDIGFDIGTNSVGWSVVGDNAQMLRFKGKNMWGVRLLDIAQTAAERRVFRSTRRRVSRRRQRVLHLQALMAEDVLRVDESFFHRLGESALIDQDKQLTDRMFGLPEHVFEGEKGKPAHKAYPTIYHLRKALCEKDTRADIRFIYLALHHIVKYRGNFLYEGQKVSSVGSDITSVMAESLAILLGEAFVEDLPGSSLEDAADTIKSASLSRKDKAAAILDVLKAAKDNKPCLDAWAKAILGMSFAWEKLIQANVSADSQLKIELSRETAEDDLLEHDPENAELIDLMMKLYRWAVFSRLRRENETLSQSMVRKYEEHKQDLQKLKRLVRKHFAESGNALYKSLFKDKMLDSLNYQSYCRQSGKCTKDRFFTYLKSVMKLKAATLADNPDFQHVMRRMGEQNEGDFLYLQRNSDNGVIPNQFQVEELEKIIEKQKKFHPSLAENGGKIRAVCSFRIPYHVGPLNKNSPFAWLERKEEGAITPWNFKDKVDISKSAEGFMAKLTSTCTYLPGEAVLPRFSPLYQEYCLLDELNKVRIVFHDGAARFLHVTEKKKMIEELFFRQKKVTKKAAVKWLAAQGIVDIEDLTGLRKDEGDAFEATLSTLIDFFSMGIPLDDREMAEEIVYWIATFQDRSILLEKLKKYPSLTPEQARYLSQRQYKGWGRLSKKLLDGIMGIYRNEPITIVEVMRESTLNFMQIINDDKLLFNHRLEEENKELLRGGKITLDDVRALPCSPALHRSIWQTMKILDEITGIMKHPPRAVYVEVTREDDPRKKGKRTIPRAYALEKIYRENLLDEVMQAELKELVSTDRNISDERLLLYFMQEGKCLYTGEPLDVAQLHLYHVDHIVPRSFKKDDSVNNKALITSRANMAKGAALVVPETFRSAQYGRWNHLRSVGLMSESKFNNLNRSGYQPEELAGFLNRQLVETSQMIKHIVTLLKAHQPDVKVQSVKARLTGDLREQYSFVKLREVNDYHHAFDALLAATIGQFIANYMSWMEDENQRNRRIRLYRDANPGGGGGMALGFFRTGVTNPETGEVHNPDRAAGYLHNAFFYKDCFITRKADIETGGFYNQQPLPKSAVLNLFPRKKALDPADYGGYANPATAYIAAIEFRNSRGKRERGLVNVPVLYAAGIGESTEKLVAFLQSGRNPYREVEVLYGKIPINQYALYDGHPIWLRSASEAWNARQLILDRESCAFAAAILKGVQMGNSSISADEFFKRFKDKLSVLYPRYRGITEKLAHTKEDWENLARQVLKDILVQLFRITSASGITGDFTKIDQFPDLKSAQGRMTNVSFDLDKLIFVDQSVTGMYERKERRCYGLSNGRHPETMQTEL